MFDPEAERKRDEERMVRDFMAGPVPVPSSGGSNSKVVDKCSQPSPRLTDLGNAELFAVENVDNCRFCHRWNAWLVWDGKRWRRDDSGQVMRLAKATVRRMYITAGGITNDAARRDHVAHAKKTESQPRIAAMLDLAKSEEQMVVDAASLDSDPYLLNVENGTIDLRTGELRDHDPNDLITRLAPVEYRPEATAPTFERFIRRVFNDDPELMKFVQKAIGYSLTGDTGEQVMFIMHGTGANGKSTLATTIRELLGDYGSAADAASLLVKRQDGSASGDIARLEGVRFVAASETEDGRRLAESKVKALTGGDVVVARHLYQREVEFKPQFKLWLGTNHKPDIRGTDHAIWRRIRLIPFSVQIPEHERDQHLLEKFKAQRAGILAWAVRGCLAWQSEGLGTPEAVRAATDGYRAESDLLAQFLDERCTIGDGYQTQASTAYAAYKDWCDQTGERSITSTKFGRQLAERGFSKRKTREGNVYKGIECESM